MSKGIDSTVLKKRLDGWALADGQSNGCLIKEQQGMFDSELQMLKDIRKALIKAEKEIAKIDPIRQLKDEYERRLVEKQKTIDAMQTKIARLEFENKRLTEDKTSIWAR